MSKRAFSNNPLRILIFQHTYFPFVGGAEIAVREITDRLGADFEFDLITAKMDKKLSDFEKIGNINVYRVGKGWIVDKYLYPFIAYRKAIKLNKERKYGIIHGIMATWGGISAMLFKLKNKNVKYLLTMQSGDSDFFMFIRTWFWHPIYKMVYTKADYIQTISNWLAGRARKYGYNGEIKVVPNGVDLDKFRMQNAECRILKSEFGIKDDEKVVITVSRLVKKNGVNYLIEAMAKVNKCKLLILGIGKDEKKLKKLVKKLNIEDRVFFLGHIKHNELTKYLWVSDIFCRPSLTEGFGNVFVEAMAAGLPVIASPVGGIVDFVEDGKTGLFCKVKNPKSIANVINKLLKDKELYNRIVENGLEMVKEKYDWDYISVEMANIYKELVA